MRSCAASVAARSSAASFCSSARVALAIAASISDFSRFVVLSRSSTNSATDRSSLESASPMGSVQPTIPSLETEPRSLLSSSWNYISEISRRFADIGMTCENLTHTVHTYLVPCFMTCLPLC